MYIDEKKSLQILLSSTQAGPGRKVKQEQEEISRNHVPRLFLGSVVYRYEIYLEGWSRYDWFCEDADCVAKLEKLAEEKFQHVHLD